MFCPGTVASCRRIHAFVVHVPGHDPLPGVDRILDGYVASGAKVLVLSADSGLSGYDTRPELDDDGWDMLLANLDRVARLAEGRGVRAVLHPTWAR